MANPSNDFDLSGWRNLTGRLIGHIANDLIARACAGKILAIVTDAVYLQTNSNEIFWLARAHVPMHARSVQCAFDANALRVGMCFSARDAILQIGERATIDLRAARVWQPRVIVNVAPREVVWARARSVETLYATSLPSASIARACRARDSAAIAEQCKALLGLGAGLTPAGDDFVGGVLFALQHVRQAYALTWDTRPLDDLLNWARAQTNVISYTMLCDHARGIGVEPLHDLWCALLVRDPSDNAVECATRLARLGNSTGVEILNGMLTALQLIQGS